MPSLNSESHVITLGFLLAQKTPWLPSILLLSVLSLGHAGARACLPAQGLSLLLAILAQPWGCMVLGLKQESLCHPGTPPNGLSPAGQQL